MSTKEYIADEYSDQIEHLNGVSWKDAPIPLRWHKCWVQTRGWSGLFHRIYRCPCGAITEYLGHDNVAWDERNSRRKKS